MRTATNFSQRGATGDFVMPDSMNEALIECVKACGGSKQVGPLLWPEKTPEAAQRLMLDCLNEDRPAHLTPEQCMHIMRLARSKGCHTGMEYLSQSLGYADPVPVDPRDEAAELQRQFIERSGDLLKMAEKIQRLQGLAVRAA
jgi:hypothetical protein